MPSGYTAIEEYCNELAERLVAAARRDRWFRRMRHQGRERP
jgi:hypothetical protein